MTSFAQQKTKQKPLKRLSNTINQNLTENKSWYLVKILEFLRLYYLKDSNSIHLTLDEISNQCENLSLDSSTKQWLISEVLPNNPRIDMKIIDNSIKFHYKPPLKFEYYKGPVRTVLNFLKTSDKPIGVEDIQDSILNANFIIKQLKDNRKVIGFIGKDKKEFLIYNNQKLNLQIHSDFIQKWKTISIEHLSNENKDISLSNTTSQQRRQKPIIIKQNQHIANQLEFYTN